MFTSKQFNVHCHGSMYSTVEPVSNNTSCALRWREIEFCCTSTDVGRSYFFMYPMRDLSVSVLVKAFCCCKMYVTTNNWIIWNGYEKLSRSGGVLKRRMEKKFFFYIVVLIKTHHITLVASPWLNKNASVVIIPPKILFDK